MIRGRAKKCPFGLDIPEGCRCAGSAVNMMTQVDNLKGDDAIMAVDENYDIMLSIEEPDSCIHADVIIDEKEIVECKFDEDRKMAPAGTMGLNGSPHYPHIFSGNAPKVDSAFPVKNYVDDNYNNNAYYGLFSYL
jgi:hypothetical protein